MRKIKLTPFFILITILSSMFAYAQLGLTEKQIIDKQGKYFKRDIEEFSILLCYNSNIIDDSGKSLPEIILYKIDKKTDKCYFEVYTSSKTAINTYIKTLNKMAVQIDDKTWKNFQNNSIYILKTEKNIVSIEHHFKNNIPSIKIVDALKNCEIDNQLLINIIETLKEQNQKFILQSKDMTILTDQGAQNIEKALASIKEKDLKIWRMQDALTKKDSVILALIKKLKEEK